ncbi:hypothetical protein MKW94_000809 [Papaver nudicaule]|uniref:Glabrous enhancer-binding protein-like DBD domain-containing protein n=1 Tax=Papaver nudicaule TaxID=74823 RepID=A0AA41VV99_PAPNU|nr:hypothetical protein [Papaver nudicaule]
MDARKSPRFADNQRASSSSSSVRRLWTDQEEIALLQGLVEFGEDDYAGFYDFIKGKGTITEDFSRQQMADKIRHAKTRRFEKYELIEKNGCQLEFSTPHQKECYWLAKRIWGNADDDETAAALGESPINMMNRKKRKASSGVGVSEEEEEEQEADDELIEKNGERVNGSKKKKQKASVLYYELMQCMDQMMKSPLSLESFLDQKAFQSIEPPKMARLEKKRKKLHIHHILDQKAFQS